MSMNRERMRKAASHVRRCAPGTFSVVALTHVPFLLLLLSLLSTLFRGGRYILAASVGALLVLPLCLLVALPMSVALSGYFIALAKGRHPRFMSIFCVFSDMLQYRHALNTTLCLLLHLLVWLCLCYAPILAAPLLPDAFTLPLAIACGALMLYVLLNRLLAYAFTAHFAWEYPYLTPREAMRLSLHVTNGRKRALLRSLLPFAFLLLLTAPSLGLLSLVVLPFFYALLADCYLEFKQCEGVLLPSPKEYADV